MEDTQFAAVLRAHLSESLGTERFDLWFGQNTRFLLRERALTVVAASAFTRDWLRRNFSDLIRNCARAALGDEVRVEFEVDDTLVEHENSAKEEARESGADETDAHSPARSGRRMVSQPVSPTSAHRTSQRPEPTLDAFVVGKCNEYAYSSARVTARGVQQASPVTFCGPTGVGKTHLLRAIRAEYRRNHPRARAVYLTAEQFTTSFVEALRGSGLPSFRQKCRGADLFLVDDVQFFAGKRASLDELLHTLDSLLAEGRQLVLASDRSLADLRPLGGELVSRLAGGLICELASPDFATRHEIVRRQARDMRIELADDVAAMVASQITAGARELRGALHRLQTVSAARGEPISRQLATQELVELAQQCSRHVRLADVEAAVCGVFGVEPEQLRSERKGRAVHEPRMLAMWLARKYTRAAWSEIGEFFGRRSHSTVIAAHRRVERLLRQQAEIGVSHRTCNVEEAIRRVEAALRTA